MWWSEVGVSTKRAQLTYAREARDAKLDAASAVVLDLSVFGPANQRAKVAA